MESTKQFEIVKLKQISLPESKHEIFYLNLIYRLVPYLGQSFYFPSENALLRRKNVNVTQ